MATIAVCAGVVTLMLALASLLERLREDPGTIGKRYQIAVALDPWLVTRRRRLPGRGRGRRALQRRRRRLVPARRADAADRLPGDHTQFEAPPLAEGRRIRAPNEIEVGVGLADPLGLRPGSVLAAQLSEAEEVRFRVVGIVRALENDGRIGWVQPGPAARRRPGAAAAGGRPRLAPAPIAPR